MNLFGTNVFLADTSHQNIDAIRYSKKQKNSQENPNKQAHTHKEQNEQLKEIVKKPQNVSWRSCQSLLPQWKVVITFPHNIDSLCTEIFITSIYV